MRAYVALLNKRSGVDVVPPNLANFHRDRPELGGNRAMIPLRIWPNSAEVRRTHRPNSRAKLGRHRAGIDDIGRILSNVGRQRAKRVQSWHASVEPCPTPVQFTQIWSTSVQVWPAAGQIWRDANRCWKCRPSLTDIALASGTFGPSSVELGRVRQKMGHHWRRNEMCAGTLIGQRLLRVSSCASSQPTRAPGGRRPGGRGRGALPRVSRQRPFCMRWRVALARKTSFGRYSPVGGGKAS